MSSEIMKVPQEFFDVSSFCGLGNYVSILTSARFAFLIVAGAILMGLWFRG